MISFNIKRLDKPLTPPPSSDNRHSPLLWSGLGPISLSMFVPMLLQAAASVFDKGDRSIKLARERENNNNLN